MKYKIQDIYVQKQQNLYTAQMKTPKLKNSSSYTFSPMRIPYNQQSTNNLLKQLQKSIINVEQIITKSKIKLGLHQNQHHHEASLEREKSYSSIHFQMSPSVTYSNDDQFTYSISPQSLSRIREDKSDNRQATKQTPKFDSQSHHFKSIALNLYQDKFTSQTSQNNSQYSQQVNIPKKNGVSLIKSSMQQDRLKQIDQAPEISIQRAQSSSSEVLEEMVSYPQYNISIKGAKKKAEEKYIKIEEQEKEKEEQKKEKSGIKKSSHLFEKYKKKLATSEKKKFQTEKSQEKNSRPGNERYLNYETEAKELKLESEEVENTCTKNQLQNMLKLTRSNRQKQKLQVKLDQLTAEYQKMKSQKRNSQRSPPRKSRELKISLQNTPVKNKPPLQTHVKTASTSSGKKYSYATKFLERKSPKSQVKQPVENAKKQQQMQRYSHPSKSIQKKKTQSVLLKQEKQREADGWSKQMFVEKMLEQCYVRRFLDKIELGEIYGEFRRKKISRLQWQQKLIEKIFQKIHKIDQLI